MMKMAPGSAGICLQAPQGAGPAGKDACAPRFSEEESNDQVTI